MILPPNRPWGIKRLEGKWPFPSPNRGKKTKKRLIGVKKQKSDVTARNGAPAPLAPPEMGRPRKTAETRGRKAVAAVAADDAAPVRKNGNPKNLSLLIPPVS